MGIPSYFSYIVKNHPEILKQLHLIGFSVNNFYLDCNSIIYDAIYNIDFSTIKEPDTDVIINKLYQK